MSDASDDIQVLRDRVEELAQLIGRLQSDGVDGSTAMIAQVTGTSAGPITGGAWLQCFRATIRRGDTAPTVDDSDLIWVAFFGTSVPSAGSFLVIDQVDGGYASSFYLPWCLG